MNRDFWNIFPVNSDRFSERIPIGIVNGKRKINQFLFGHPLEGELEGSSNQTALKSNFYHIGALNRFYAVIDRDIILSNKKIN
jgi:hypothetical protein